VAKLLFIDTRHNLPAGRQGHKTQDFPMGLKIQNLKFKIGNEVMDSIIKKFLAYFVSVSD
jgi:hypothetical protein